MFLAFAEASLCNIEQSNFLDHCKKKNRRMYNSSQKCSLAHKVFVEIHQCNESNETKILPLELKNLIDELKKHHTVDRVVKMDMGRLDLYSSMLLAMKSNNLETLSILCYQSNVSAPPWLDDYEVNEIDWMYYADLKSFPLFAAAIQTTNLNNKTYDVHLPVCASANGGTQNKAKSSAIENAQQSFTNACNKIGGEPVSTSGSTTIAESRVEPGNSSWGSALWGSVGGDSGRAQGFAVHMGLCRINY